MVVAIFDGDAVTDAMAVCSLPAPELTASVSAAAAAGPTWSAVARAVSVSTLAERGDCYSAARAILWPAGVRAVSVFSSVARDNFYPCALFTDTRRTRRLFGSSWCRPDGEGMFYGVSVRLLFRNGGGKRRRRRYVTVAVIELGRVTNAQCDRSVPSDAGGAESARGRVPMCPKPRPVAAYIDSQ